MDRYRTLRADLILVMADVEVEGHALRCELRPEPAEEIAADARVALFTTRAESCDGVEPIVASTNLARRGALAADLDRAAAEGCDIYLTELKAAAIDTVAARAAAEGARVVFVRNRPVALDGDLDAALMELLRRCLRRSSSIAGAGCRTRRGSCPRPSRPPACRPSARSSWRARWSGGWTACPGRRSTWVACGCWPRRSSPSTRTRAPCGATATGTAWTAWTGR